MFAHLLIVLTMGAKSNTNNIEGIELGEWACTASYSLDYFLMTILYNTLLLYTKHRKALLKADTKIRSAWEASVLLSTSCFVWFLYMRKATKGEKGRKPFLMFLRRAVWFQGNSEYTELDSEMWLHSSGAMRSVWPLPQTGAAFRDPLIFAPSLLDFEQLPQGCSHPSLCQASLTPFSASQPQNAPVLRTAAAKWLFIWASGAYGKRRERGMLVLQTLCASHAGENGQ